MGRYHLPQETLLDAADASVDAVGVDFASPVPALPAPAKNDSLTVPPT
ncbi:MAG: hypothetical protein ACRD3O_17180 [Terriglobia bacterium]